MDPFVGEWLITASRLSNVNEDLGVLAKAQILFQSVSVRCAIKHSLRDRWSASFVTLQAGSVGTSMAL